MSAATSSIANGAAAGNGVATANGVAATNGATANSAAANRAVSESVGQLERDRLRMMMLIRRFEEKTYQEYTRPGQKIGGFCHLYSGQEAIAVGTAALFDQSRDYLLTGYRCHGASLAMGMPPRAAMAEMFGKATGCSKGKAGRCTCSTLRPVTSGGMVSSWSIAHGPGNGLRAVVQKKWRCDLLLHGRWRD